MTHSAYIADPDGYGLEVLYNVPAEAWQDDVDAALNYFEYLVPKTFEDRTDYQRFGPGEPGRRRCPGGSPPARPSRVDRRRRELLDVAVAAARAGGAVLVDGLGRPIHVDHKTERTSIVTATDLAAQAEIVEIITAHDPHHAILGEEDRAGAPRAPSRGSSTRSTARPTTPTVCRSRARRSPWGTPRRRRRGDLRAVPRELFTAAAAPARGSATSGSQVSATETLEQALVCTGVQSDDPRADRRVRRASPSSPAVAEACGPSAHRRCAWPTSPPGASTPSWRPIRPTPGTSAPAP